VFTTLAKSTVPPAQRDSVLLVDQVPILGDERPMGNVRHSVTLIPGGVSVWRPESGSA
jgi:hypothetical protein